MLLVGGKQRPQHYKNLFALEIVFFFLLNETHATVLFTWGVLQRTPMEGCLHQHGGGVQRCSMHADPIDSNWEAATQTHPNLMFRSPNSVCVQGHAPARILKSGAVAVSMQPLCPHLH